MIVYIVLKIIVPTGEGRRYRHITLFLMYFVKKS